jgi:hypothetical protein
MTAAEGSRGTSGNGGNGHKRPELKLRVPESVAGGTYANSMMVHHTHNEFIMDYAMVMAGSGQVVARVVTSPAHMKHIVEALADNVRKYESAHGPIEPRRTEE